MLPHLLIIEPSRAYRALICDRLAPHFDVVAIHEPLDALRWIEDGNKPHLIICSSRPGNFHGPDIIKLIRLYLSKNEVPVIMTTPKMHFSERSDAFLSGANAYVPLPGDADQLLAALQPLISETGK